MNGSDLTTSGIFNANLRMSSLEIAELMGKEHFNVLRDIRALIDQGAIGQLRFEESSYLNSQNKEQPMYLLGFESTLLLITGYDANRRAKVINRWVQLERGEALPAGSLHDTLINVPVIKNLVDVVSDLLADRGKLEARVHRLENSPISPNQRKITPTSVKPFLAAHYRQDSNAATNKGVIYELYREYCQKTASIVEPRAIFFKIIYQQGLSIRPGKLSVQGRITKVVRGFGIKDAVGRQLELFPALVSSEGK